MAGEPQAGELVWHYTDGAGLLSILANQVLWATASGYLNDSGEVALGQRLLLERFTDLAGQEHPVFAGLRNRLERAGDQRGPDASWFFILSAATSPDSLAMWRTYGGRGESYALGLEAASPLKVLVDDPAAVESRVVRQRTWSAVRYDEQGQRDLVEAVYTQLANELDHVLQLRDRVGTTTADYLAALDDTLEAAEQALLLIKHPGFREEHETRHTTVVLGAGSRAQTLAGLARFRHGAYGVTPYLELTGGAPSDPGRLTTQRSPLPIRAIAISPSRNGAAARDSVASMLASHHLDDVRIVPSEIPFRS